MTFTTYFISGHLDLTQTQWEQHYKLRIDCILSEEPNSRFVLGEAREEQIRCLLNIYGTQKNLNRRSELKLQ